MDLQNPCSKGCQMNPTGDSQNDCGACRMDDIELQQEQVAEKIEDPVIVPRGLLGAACHAIEKKHDAAKVLAKLRAITFGRPAAQPQVLARDERAAFEAAARGISWPEHAFAVDGTGTYLTRYTEWSWKLWQVRAAWPQQHAAAPGTCTWIEDASENAWDSSCGEKWYFIDGGPTENRVRFCQGCGKPVHVAASGDGRA